MSGTVVLAFSGGLDTCWCVLKLREQGFEVVTVTVDVGGIDADERESLAAKSRALGAREHRQVDARQLYHDEILRYLIMGNVRKGAVYPLCVGSERSLQARVSAEVAAELGAGALAHGCTAAGNDQVRFEIALAAAAPGLEIIAPVRDLGPRREEQIAALTAAGLPLPAGGGLYSINSGLWGVTIGGRETLTSEGSLPEEAWVRTRGAFADLDRRETLRLGFAAGEVTSLNGEGGAAIELIERIDAIAAAFGIGRGIHLGETILGTKGRVAFEAPAATLILAAHRELEKLVLTGAQIRIKESLAETYGELVHGGRHADPACRDIEALFRSSQERVDGEVTIELRPGHMMVTGLKSPWSLMGASRSVYGESAGEWSGAEARGFSRLVGLPTILHARIGGPR
ncbi:MAG: argininosuccinate synthase [Planctomycetes bacterium]|nr:argininosuccinate synthase [Planctomycetota bacterium]